MITQAIASVRGTRGNSLLNTNHRRASTKMDHDYYQKKPHTSTSPFKRQIRESKVTSKNHPTINECFDAAANNPHGMLYGMGEQPMGLMEGKRIFLGKTNISDKTGMYPTIKEDKEVKDLFMRMSDLQYYDKSKIEYVAPPVSKHIE